MVKVSDFSSVLEISFAVNGLMYYFDVMPKLRDEHNAVMKEYIEAENKNHNAGYKSYCNWGQAIRFMVTERILRILNIAMSALSFVLLLVGAYFPDQQLWTWLMTMFVGVMLAVPAISFAVLHGESKALRALTQQRNRDYEMDGLVEGEPKKQC